MSDSSDKIKLWVDTWERAGKAMDEIKKQELSDPDYYNKTIKTFEDMLNYAVDNTVVTQTSGLIEMQRYFLKLAKINGQFI